MKNASGFWFTEHAPSCARNRTSRAAPLTPASASSATLPADIVFDGRDPLPLLLNEACSPHESFYFKFRQHAALRKGDWKIVREDPDQAWRLFHLKYDERELHNLAKDRPEKVNELQEAFREWKATFRGAE